MYSIFYVILCVVIFMCKLELTKAYYTRQWVVHITGNSNIANQVARDHGFTNLGEIFEDYYHFVHSRITKRSINPNHGRKVRLAVDTRVRWAQQQIAKQRVKRDLRLQDSDPKWPSMWYLNRGNDLDMNVIPAWLEGITGKGAVVTILDDGLEKDHPDLIKNYDPLASYDVNNHDSDPSPRYDMIDSNRHGTRCAGEVAATSNNSVCAVGVAYGAHVGGVRMLDGDVTDAVEARSLSLNPQHIDIYSASWGPDDDGKTVDGPGELATRAFVEGVSKGRKGKGSIFVWASGNGGRDHDNCNCDGYTNSIYSLSISSATEQGHVPWYSEACSSTLASTYSSGAIGERQVVTTDLHHSCTSGHTGTSASAPLAAGICALALEANPNLTWRDMQHIVVRTARPQHLFARDWQMNGIGRNVSHSFGYGLMDAYAMVQLARKWITVPEQHRCEISAPHVERSIPPKSQVVLQLLVKECEGVQILEHVQAKLTIFSHRRGDLRIQLTSPMGTKVTLLAHRVHDISRAGFNHWPFMSVHSWGETPFGVWQLEIHNDGGLLGRATLQNWSLVLYGTKKFSVGSRNEKGKSSAKKKNNKKGKNRNNAKSIATNNNNSTLKTIKNSISMKNKNAGTSSQYYIPYGVINVQNGKKKKISNVLLSTMSPYYYSVNNSNVHTPTDVGKGYWKFIKNITITYPVMIPAQDGVKITDASREKKQRPKEKSRDLNSNRNSKLVTTKAPFIAASTISSHTVGDKIKSGAEVHAWELILYGTNTPPEIDKSTKTNGYPSKQSKLNVNNFDHNSVDNEDSHTEFWKSDVEMKKDTTVLETSYSQASSSESCIKSNNQLCLECARGFFLHNGKCHVQCSDKFYPASLEIVDRAETVDESDDPNYTHKCLLCHYSCRRCTGSNDYQCIACYPDAILVRSAASESYCYPSSLIAKLDGQVWYTRIAFLLWLILIANVSFLIYHVYQRKRWQQMRANHALGVDTLNRIRSIEENVKTAVYSDSD